MRKILIFGAKGMLGITLMDYLTQKSYNAVGITRKDFNIFKSDNEKLCELLESNKPEFIINASGIIKQKIHLFSIEEVIEVNSVFPRNLYILSEKQNSKIIHITTDCVYNGSKGNYNEEDLFDAEDVYGMTKCAGEITGAMNIRTSIIGEEDDSNYSLLAWVKSMKCKKINGFKNHLWNGVTTLYLAELIDIIIDNDLYKPGMFHLHSPSIVSKFELLEIINRVYELNLTIKPIDHEQKIDRSLKSLHKLQEIVTKDIELQLKDLKEFYE
jgi:dTDP-4-dehydrorhamnose reductase